MAFQIKDFASITASMVNLMRGSTTKITDFQPGSVARTLVEAAAVEVDEYYQQMFQGLLEAIPVATYKSFGFDLLPAKRAFGYASVSSIAPLAQAVTIPAGTAFSTSDGITYASTVAVTWAAGSTLVRVPVQADAAGVSGNAAPGTITACTLFPTSGGFTVGNELIDNGADAESDSERALRFADYVSSLSRGTDTACMYAARSATTLDSTGIITEYVTRAGYDEEPGTMRIWIYGNQGLPSASLLATAQRLEDGYRNDAGEIVPGYRPAGVRVDVRAMAERSVSLAVQVSMLPGYSLTSAVRQSLSDVYGAQVRAVSPGDTLLMQELVTALLTVDGVVEVVPSSTSNIVCAANEALIPGTLTVTAL